MNILALLAALLFSIVMCDDVHKSATGLEASSENMADARPLSKVDWVRSNAGGENNAGGGGLEGEKCRSFFPNCVKCSEGFKACGSCIDGYVLLNGVCRLIITLNFDDISLNNGQSTQLQNGDYGLNWSNFYVMNPEALNYMTGRTSSRNVGFNGYGSPASFSGQVFKLLDLQLTSAWFNNNVVTFEGKKNGAVKATHSVTVNTSGPTHVVFPGDFEDIDEVYFASSNWQVVIDDMRFAAAY